MSYLCNNEDKVNELINRISDAKEIVYDAETSGLDCFNNFICGHVFTFGERPSDTYYVPVRHGGGGNLPGLPRYEKPDIDQYHEYHPFEIRVSEVLRKKTDYVWVGHNLQFDLGFTETHGFPLPPRVECTQVNSQILNENAKGYSLDACSQRARIEVSKDTSIYDYIEKVVPEARGKKKGAMGYFWRLAGDNPRAVKYAGDDGVVTWQLWKRQLKGIEQQELERIRHLESRVTRLLHRMKMWGIQVDISELYYIKNFIDKKLQEWDEFSGGINLRGGGLVKIFEKHGVTDWPTTPKTGRPSFTESWLKQSEIGRKVVYYRQFRTLRDSSVNPLINSFTDENGIVHVNYNQLKGDDFGVLTGRLSSNAPNMQSIPKRKVEQGKLLRKAFIPRAGCLWHEADYSQQEYRIFTHYSNSEFLIDAYNNGQDMHQTVANMLGVERDPTAKRINLGVLYGMGSASLAETLGVDESVAREYINRHREMIPEATRFLRSAKSVADSRGYVKTIMGRRRRFPNGEFTRKSGNAIIQAASADQTKLAMVNLQDAFDQIGGIDKVLLQTHDSISSEIEEHFKEERERLVREIMCDHGPDSEMPLKVQVVVDQKTGKNFAEATYG